MDTLSPEPDLESARRPLPEATTLPPRCYIDPAFHRREVDAILRREWMAVAREDQVPSPGDYLSFELLGEPLVAVRGDDGQVRVLSRVCRHRWMPVVDGSGNRRTFQCPYHLWTYDLDGRLRGAPDMERAAGFDRSACALPALRVETWQGWVFVNLDPQAAALAPRLEGLRRVVEPYRPAAMRTTEPLVFEHEWNWKVMVENFMESYHHAGIHPDTFQPLVPGNTTTVDEVEGDAYAILRNPARGGGAIPPLFPVTPGLGDAERAQFVVCAVFPLLLFSVQHDSMVWYRLEPRGVDRIALAIHACVPPEAADAPGIDGMLDGMRAFLDTVHRQDMVACEGVWKGLNSSLAAPGRLSHLEKAIWQLGRFVLARVAG
jgi:phenylpropionate dioxygenase-like ring-hydroxylating dioxygenase large terminal subunit